MNRLAIILLLLSSYGFVTAQNYEGTDFYFSFMANLQEGINNPPIFEVTVHATENLEATLEFGLPDDPFYFSQQQSIAADELGVFTFDFDQYLNQQTLNEIETRSFRLITTDTAKVYAFHNRLFFSDASAILPVSSLSDDYMPVSVQCLPPVGASTFSIIAVNDSTSVTVVPSDSTPLGDAGETISFTLDAREVITISSSGDLSGSRISTDGNPVAVFGGHQFSHVTINCGATSHMWEQSIPIEYWSHNFPVIPVEGNGGDLIKILAVQDDTEIFLGCELIGIIDEGEFFELLIDTAAILTSTFPISVSSFLVGKSCSNLDSGDPNLRNILPLERGNTEVKIKANYGLQEFGPPFDGPRFSFVHLVTLSSETSEVVLNGIAVEPWQVFPNQPEMSYARIPVNDIDSELSIQSDSPFWAEYISMASFDALTLSLGSNEIIDIPTFGSGIVNLGLDQNICPGENLLLTNGTSSSGVWQDGSFQDDFLVTAPGTYNVFVDSACGTGFDEIIIGEGFVPTLEIPEIIEVCSEFNDSLQIVPEIDVTYTWNTGDTGTTVHIDGLGLYAINALSVDGCETMDTFEVILGDFSEIEILAPEFLCAGDTLTISAVSDETGMFLWNDSILGSSISVFESGQYLVAFFPSDSGCAVIEQATIREESLPFIVAEDTLICAGDSVLLVAVSPNGEVSWPNESDESTLQVFESGIYEAAAENECGISFREVNVFQKDCSCPVQVPNVFTPNGDGLNDLFVPEILCEPQFYELVIFNRWGKEVFSSNDIDRSWNGDSNNNEDFFSADGVYNYILKYDNPLRPLQSPRELNGTVTLVR